MQRILLKLLIVDDKPSEREGIASIIDWESIGISVVATAENGLDGIEKARALKPDIIITDIVMPHADGFKMVESIREFLPDVKVIFISCFDNFNFAKSAINMNAMGYVLKPIIASELMDTISKVTGLHLKEVKKKEEEEALIRRLRENFPVLREQLIRDILFGFIRDENAIWNKIEFLGIGLRNGHYAVLAVEYDDYENETEEKKQLYSLKIKEYICKFCEKQSDKAGFFVICIEKSRYAILINIHGHEEFSISNFSETLKEELTAKFSLSFAMGVSKAYNRITEVHRCYQEACDALKFKLYLGKNQIFNYSEIYRGSNSPAALSTISLQNDLKYLMKTGDTEEIEKFAEGLFANESFTDNNHYIQYVCISILYCLQINLIELNEKPDSITDDIFAAFDKFYTLESIDDAKDRIKNLIYSISSYLNSKDRRRNKKVIEVLKKYMHENYSKDLTVSDIAEKAYLSPCYANYIFKRETGVTLIEYLTRIRIEKARYLLKNSLLKVYEIAEKVGYKSNSYFITVFKEHCKMTPLEYRDRR
ncbi:MAG TPA: response regulator [Clostridiales bacterium]|nr:response regulator [Clostridiales bacterium]